MLAGAVLVVLALLVIAQVIAGVMVRFISFELESALYEQLTSVDAAEHIAPSIEKAAYLQSLAEDLAEYMDLPEGMVIKAHYDPSDIANAYATLGGNIVIYQGLIDQVSSENGLAMVVAHEIGHIKNRDPIMSLGRGTVTVIGLAILTGFGDSSAMSSIVNITGGGVLAKFSRNQESQADQDAVAAMLGLYGTLEGADEFFVNMSAEEPDLGVVFFSTHPATESRIERIENAGSSRARADVDLVPLPDLLMLAEESELLVD